MPERRSDQKPQIVFTLPAIDDLRRIGPSAVPQVLKKVLILESNPKAGLPLGDELAGFRKLVVGKNTWRIVYRITETDIEICEVWAVGLRSDGEVYSEAITRIANSERPELAGLTEVVTRLGRLAGIEIPTKPVSEPVPDWLAERLMNDVGIAPHEVAAMDAPGAFNAWTEYCSRKR